MDIQCNVDDNPILVEAPSEQNCSICGSSKEAVQKFEAPPSSSNSTESKDPSKVRPGWPVIRRSVLTEEKPKASVMQWAMRLPARYSTSLVAHPERKPKKSNSINAQKLDGGKSPSLTSLTNQNKQWEIPKELEALQQKYSSVCRLFSYKELMDATSSFSPGMPFTSQFAAY